MGGSGSGRHRSRVTVEESLRLDLARLIRCRQVVPGAYCAGSLAWTVKGTGKQAGFINYQANLIQPAHAFARLHYIVNNLQQDYYVRVVRTPCRFGGWRWWWICPLTGQMAGILHLPPGEAMFACRRAYRLAYASERESGLASTHSRQQRIFKKLGSSYRQFGQPAPDRPKGMHRRTYEGLLVELYAAMAAHEAAIEKGALRILARPPKTYRDGRLIRLQAARS